MIILAGSLFGVQLGAIGTTYVREYTVKIVMGMIMSIVLFSRLFKLPVYLSGLSFIPTLASNTTDILSKISFAILALALALLAGMMAILIALVKGMIEHRDETAAEHARRSYEATLEVATAES